VSFTTTTTESTMGDKRFADTDHVLVDWEHNGYHDSDFYALVWDGERLAVREYATTRGACDMSKPTLTSDADAIAAARAFAVERAAKLLAASDEQAAARVADGKLVVADVGPRVRKVKSGTYGWVGNKRPSEFRTYYRNGYNDPAAEHNQVVDLDVALDGVASGARIRHLPVSYFKVVDPASYQAPAAVHQAAAEAGVPTTAGDWGWYSTARLLGLYA